MHPGLPDAEMQSTLSLFLCVSMALNLTISNFAATMKYSYGLFILLLLVLGNNLTAQNRLACIVEDAEAHERLANVSLSVEKLRTGGVTDSAGSIIISNIPSGQQKLS